MSCFLEVRYFEVLSFKNHNRLFWTSPTVRIEPAILRCKSWCLPLYCRYMYIQGRTGHITRWKKSQGVPLVLGPQDNRGTPTIMTFFVLVQLNLWKFSVWDRYIFPSLFFFNVLFFRGPIPGANLPLCTYYEKCFIYVKSFLLTKINKPENR
jgi:hypothetical protein